MTTGGGGDIGLLFDPGTQVFDVNVADNDLVTDQGLRTPLLISLFTDRRVTADDKPPEDDSLRGWWGDLFPDVTGDQIGSRLWLLKREKRSLETLNRAEEYSREALQWLLDDGVAELVESSASYDSQGFLELIIGITRPGQEKKSFKFKAAWDAEVEKFNAIQ